MKTFSLLSALAVFVACPSGSHAITAFGLTPTGLVGFDTSLPGTITSTSTFSGLTGGDTIVDIDYRPQNGTLYGIAPSGRLYTINPFSGAAALDTSGSIGTVENMDFNPVANRLRVLSAADQNFRITPGTGVVTDDGVFAYGAGDPNLGANALLGSAAYTNNFTGGAATTLYSVDTALDILVTHTGAPQFSTLGTVGSLGVDIGSSVGFDIVGANNDAFLSNGQNLYSVNLTTGALTSIGTIGAVGAAGVLSLAVVPEPSIAATGMVAALGFLAQRRRP